MTQPRVGPAKPCPTCSGPNRTTAGMVCQTCGTDYGPPFNLGDALADIGRHYSEGALSESEAHRLAHLYCDQREAPAGNQNTAAWVVENGAAYLDIHPGPKSTQQLEVRDDLLVDIAADGRIVGVERIGWLVMAADLVEVLAALRVSGCQFYLPTPAEEVADVD